MERLSPHNRRVFNCNCLGPLHIAAVMEPGSSIRSSKKRRRRGRRRNRRVIEFATEEQVDRQETITFDDTPDRLHVPVSSRPGAPIRLQPGFDPTQETLSMPSGPEESGDAAILAFVDKLTLPASTSTSTSTSTPAAKDTEVPSSRDRERVASVADAVSFFGGDGGGDEKRKSKRRRRRRDSFSGSGSGSDTDPDPDSGSDPGAYSFSEDEDEDETLPMDTAPTAVLWSKPKITPAVQLDDLDDESDEVDSRIVKKEDSDTEDFALTMLLEDIPESAIARSGVIVGEKKKKREVESRSRSEEKEEVEGSASPSTATKFMNLFVPPPSRRSIKRKFHRTASDGSDRDDVDALLDDEDRSDTDTDSETEDDDSEEVSSDAETARRGRGRGRKRRHRHHLRDETMDSTMGDSILTMDMDDDTDTDTEEDTESESEDSDMMTMDDSMMTMDESIATVKMSPSVEKLKKEHEIQEAKLRAYYQGVLRKRLDEIDVHKAAVHDMSQELLQAQNDAKKAQERLAARDDTVARLEEEVRELKDQVDQVTSDKMAILRERERLQKLVDVAEAAAKRRSGRRRTTQPQRPILPADLERELKDRFLASLEQTKAEFENERKMLVDELDAKDAEIRNYKSLVRKYAVESQESASALTASRSRGRLASLGQGTGTGTETGTAEEEEQASSPVSEDEDGDRDGVTMFSMKDRLEDAQRELANKTKKLKMLEQNIIRSKMETDTTVAEKDQQIQNLVRRCDKLLSQYYHHALLSVKLQLGNVNFDIAQLVSRAMAERVKEEDLNPWIGKQLGLQAQEKPAPRGRGRKRRRRRQ